MRQCWHTNGELFPNVFFQFAITKGVWSRRLFFFLNRLCCISFFRSPTTRPRRAIMNYKMLFFNSEEQLLLFLYIPSYISIALFPFDSFLSHPRLKCNGFFFKPMLYPLKFHNFSKREAEPTLLFQLYILRLDCRGWGGGAGTPLVTHSKSGWSLSGKEITPNLSQTHHRHTCAESASRYRQDAVIPLPAAAWHAGRAH